MEIREFILSYIRDGNEIIDPNFDLENNISHSIDTVSYTHLTLPTKA